MRRVYLAYLDMLCSQPYNCPRQANSKWFSLQPWLISVADPLEGHGEPGPHLFLDAKLGPKEPKNFFGDRPRSRPSPYLKVWIRLF